MAISNAVINASSVWIYDEKGRRITSIPAYDGLVGFTSSTVSIRNASSIWTYNEKGKRISSIPCGNKEKSKVKEPAISTERPQERQQKRPQERPREQQREQQREQPREQQREQPRERPQARTSERSQRFEISNDRIFDKILIWIAFLLIATPFTYVLFITVKNDVSLTGNMQRLEMFAFGESIVFVLAFVVRKWLARLLKRVLWLTGLVIFIGSVIFLIGYLGGQNHPSSATGQQFSSTASVPISTPSVNPLGSLPDPVAQQIVYTVVGVSNGDLLNVHSEPSSSSSITAKLPNGYANVRIIGASVMNDTTEWVNISCEAGSGWVNKQYLETE